MACSAVAGGLVLEGGGQPQPLFQRLEAYEKDHKGLPWHRAGFCCVAEGKEGECKRNDKAWSAHFGGPAAACCCSMEVWQHTSVDVLLHSLDR